MLCRVLLVSLVCVPFAATAAPVPPENDAAKLRRVYGETVDPDKDCTFELKGEKLRVGIPGTHHSLKRGVGRMNAPRVLRDVQGDFVVTVRVDFFVGGKVAPQVSGDPLFASAGLLLWVDDTRFVTLARSLWTPEGKTSATQIDGGYSSPLGTGGFRGPDQSNGRQAALLRITREGNRVIVGAGRTDGGWDEFPPFDVGLPDKMKVGLFLQHNTSALFEATFDQYTLTQPKK